MGGLQTVLILSVSAILFTFKVSQWKLSQRQDFIKAFLKRQMRNTFTEKLQTPAINQSAKSAWLVDVGAAISLMALAKSWPTPATELRLFNILRCFKHPFRARRYT